MKLIFQKDTSNITHLRGVYSVKDTHMLKQYSFFLTLAFIFLSSCADPQIETENIFINMPAIPSNLYIDMDEDGLSDYKISYALQELETKSPRFSINAVLEALDGHDILLKPKNDVPLLTDESLILPDIESLYFYLTLDQNWNKIRDILLVQIQDGNSVWGPQWTVNTQEIFETYFIGVRLNEDEYKTGWIELSIDINTGIIQLVNKELFQ